ncbi:MULTISPECIES: response regulator [unclassified Streptomyces]|uniref:response regulator n=1 Tax=unclassified Streptomyces TaxID=2593676 RepID=UPI0003634CDC|nr:MULTISPECIES: response regulator [unclassified Streptomyces]MYT27607.1 hypothetical protein [Streptomyces sp. SID8354]
MASGGLRGGGYTVEHVIDGLTGLQPAQQHPYQVIILEVMLPGAHGWRICAELRRRSP